MHVVWCDLNTICPPNLIIIIINESSGHHHSSDCSSISADIEYISYISITNIIVFITRVIIIINMLTDSRYTVINSFAHYNRSVVN